MRVGLTLESPTLDSSLEVFVNGDSLDIYELARSEVTHRELISYREQVLGVNFELNVVLFGRQVVLQQMSYFRLFQSLQISSPRP